MVDFAIVIARITKRRTLSGAITESQVLDQTDAEWPKPNEQGKQELTIEIGKKEKSLRCSKIGSFTEVLKCSDRKGMEIFYYLIQDLKCLFFSLIGLHFKLKPT